MRSRWVVVWAFAGLGVATQVSWLAYAATTTAAAGHFGVSEQAVGWLANLFPLLFVVLAIPAGVALDRALRPTLAVGAVLIAVGAALRVTVDVYWAALVGQMLAAVAQPVLAGAITRVAAAYLRVKDRPLGIAIGAGATYLGMITAIGIGTAIPDDVPLVVAVGAGFSILTAVAGLVALKVAPGYDRVAAGSPLAVWRAPGVPVLAAVVFLGMGIFVALATWLEPLLAPAGIGADTSGLLLLLMLVAGVAGCVVVPPWAARRSAEPRALQLAGLVTALVCLLLGFLPKLTGFATSPLLGFALLSALPVALAMVERHDPERAGPITSLVWLTGNAGGLVVSLGVGLLLDTPALAFALLAVLGVGAAVLAARLQRHEDQVPGPGRHGELAGSGDAGVRE
ncbi:MFS transporter [Actinokineospora diospyrosa]|uniref:Arabinose efflux permease, MFS family n=1 Tax=Actinokineospora diospyrosa TaxID=103728 RepID=A0ABT1IK50_9PSEU|nr:MFS transporter [Actinokineospora diospyrosa]MCP2273027.1 putative arabinose efflux permease, MFS family [Actinokineospora diospyrosa]